MSEQYCLFDEEQAAEGVGPYKAVPQEPIPLKPWRGPAPGMRFLRIVMESGFCFVIETSLSMLELSNELRSKQKVKLTRADGYTVEVRSQDVRYLENEYRVPV